MEIITGIVSEIGKTIVESIGTQFGYLIHYDDNIQALEKQAKELADQRADLQRSVEAEERNGRVIATSVKTWLANVDSINPELKKFLEEETKANPRCLKGWCLNLKSRYSLSKKANNKSKEVAELQKEGKFERISTPAPPPKMGSMFTEVKGFESRIKVMNEVLQSLTDDEIHMIGICGMGGVGKTTMVKEVIKTVERETKFKDVAMAVVSQNPAISRIQGEIADRLRLKFNAETVRGRAEELHERLMRSKKVLIILDDVWEELDLEEIGIPSGSNHKGCNIIVTSREKDVTTKMKSQKTFTVSILSEGEDWDLFVEMAGDSSKQPDLLPIAKEVTKECGGLPLAIAAVGKALGGKAKEVWLDALNQLRKSSVSSLKEMNDLVFSRIKFSFNYLGNEESKSCFLLCCLFPEDFNIPVEFLVQYGVGLNLFKGIDSLYEARNRVYAITEKLKSSYLLLDSDQRGCVKLHDVVRDCALSIVSQGERVFLVNHGDQLTKWPSEDAYKHCTAISLLCRKIEEYPDAAECPKLELLQLTGENFLWIKAFSLPKGMENLKVLALKGLTFQSRHSSSFEVLENLRTLCLNYCNLDNLRFLRALQTLEILSLVGSMIGEFSEELGELRHLKVLDLTGAECNEGIAPGILSNLSQLEELYLRKISETVIHQIFRGRPKPVNWRSMKEELKLLSHLKTLFVDFLDQKALPQNFLFDNLLRFRISMYSAGSREDDRPFYRGPNSLKICGDLRLIVESGMNRISKKAESLSLRSVDNMKYGLHELEGQGFPRLKDLTLDNCHDLDYVIDAEDCTPQTAFPLLEKLSLKYLHKLTEIWHGQLPNEQQWLPCFGNLRCLEIESCSMLKSIIPVSIARGLVQLHDLEVKICENMEEIFSQEENQDGITFPNLTLLTLSSLPKLISFCKVTDDASLEDPSLNHQVKSLGSQGSNSSSRMGRITEIQQDVQFGESKLHLVPNVHVLLDSQWILRLPNLKKLEVDDNDSLEVVFDLGGPNVGRLSHHVEKCERIEMLAQLTKVRLTSLRKLTGIWMHVPKGFQGFGNLRLLWVESCPNLTQLFPPSTAKLLVKLEEVNIEACSTLESIVARGTEEGKEAYNFKWPSLKVLIVRSCEKMNTFGSTIQSARKVKSIKDAPVSSTTNDSDIGRRNASKWSRTVCSCLCPKLKSNQSQEHDDSNFDEPTSENEDTKCGLKETNFTRTNNIEDSHSFFPPSLMCGVQNLQELQLDSCASIELIFDLSGPDEEENHDVLALNALERLLLINLSKLIHVWKVGPKDIGGFQNLKWLTIERCNSLRNLIPLSIAKLLVMLEMLKIHGCESMEEVVAEGVKDEKMDKITFPKLNHIQLWDLQNLATFYSGGRNIEFPLLTEISVVGCPRLKTFVLSNVMTPELQKVCMEEVDYSFMGDLNNTIRNIFDAQGNKFDQGTSESSRTK